MLYLSNIAWPTFPDFLGLFGYTEREGERVEYNTVRGALDQSNKYWTHFPLYGKQHVSKQSYSLWTEVSNGLSDLREPVLLIARRQDYAHVF